MNENNIVFVGKTPLVTQVSRHVHNFFEIMYITAGEGLLFFDNGKKLEYHTKNIVVIPPFISHENSSTAGFENIVIHLDNCTLTYTTPTLFMASEDTSLYDAFKGSFYYYSGQSENRSAILSAYGDLICSIIPSLNQHSDKKEIIVQSIIHDIIDHFTDSNYNLGEYLHSLPFSYNYLIRLFKESCHTTPHQYLLDKRLCFAADYLSASKITNISEISYMSGFKDPLYFSRMFKQKYHVSPTYFAAHSEYPN